MFDLARAVARIRAFAVVLALSAFAGLACAAEPIRVVYHLSEGLSQAQRAVVNIRNHLNAEPATKIVVVAHDKGVDFLIEGAKNERGQDFAAAIGDLAGRGVEFRVCNNTLVGYKIPKEQVAMEATIVESGVAEIARLQAKEGYAYLRP